MKLFPKMALLVAILAAQSFCANPPDRQAELEALVQILDQDRIAHIQNSPELMRPHLAQLVVEVSEGEVVTRRQDEIIQSFEDYFYGAIYYAWEDVIPPKIAFSEDLTMAWVIRKVRVDREEPINRTRQRVQFESAWTATYEKDTEGWKMTSVTSTFVNGNQ